MSFLVIGISGCVDNANQNQTVRVNLLKDAADTFEGEYLLRFDAGGNQYYKIGEGSEEILLIGTDIKVPQSDKDKLVTQIQESKVTLKSHVVSGPSSETQSQVYALRVKLKVAATPESANKSFRSDLKVIFPAVLEVRNRLGVPFPSSIPEISFPLNHHTKYSQYGFGRLLPDIGFLFNGFMTYVTLGTIVCVWWVISTFIENREKAVWMLGALVFSVLVLLSLIFPTLRNIFWIVSGLWGQ